MGESKPSDDDDLDSALDRLGTGDAPPAPVVAKPPTPTPTPRASQVIAKPTVPAPPRPSTPRMPTPPPRPPLPTSPARTTAPRMPAVKPPAEATPAPVAAPAPGAPAADAVPVARPSVATPSQGNAIPQPIGAKRISTPMEVIKDAHTPTPDPNRNSGQFPVARPAFSPPRQQKPSNATALLPADQQFPKPEPKPDMSLSQAAKAAAEPRKAIELSDNMQIDRFGLIREIARGGMGQVFLARDTKLGRKVAIKFLLVDDPNFAQRFLIEARATARVTHENIVSIYEVGEYLGLPYMVLEYLEGKTLSQVLETKPGPRQFAEIMLSVARGLERAHEHGIVHRDLKPSNIFVTDRGQVKVLDFGVARIFDAGGDAAEKVASSSGKDRNWDSGTEGGRNTYVTFSGGGTLVGTLPYMSPEQWGADTVDHQSDIWACGIMFWRALTGVHPAGTMNADKLKRRLTDLDKPLPSIGEREPSLPKELVAIVDKCLYKKKSERYANATELIADLQSFLAPATGRLPEDQSPYRGLAAFGENDAKFFFGRSNEIRTALAQLEAWPLLAVIGPSGVGKSSFVHAGLVPAVRGTGGNWQVRVLRPGRHPLQSLASTLDDSIDSGVVGADVLEGLAEAPGLYGEMLRKAAAKRKHKVLIVVDQLEELFTLSDDDEQRKLFLAALLAAADDATSPVRVVLSMRADFLDRLADHKHFLNELSRGLFFLSAPDQDNLRETLVRPAELAGYTFSDPWIVDDMMQAATSKGALPLLQFAATRLWDARDRAKRQLTIQAYNGMGGVGGAFARHADEVAAAVPPQSQRLLRAIMTRLVTPEGTRAVVDHQELLDLSADKGEVERILDQLVRARLILMHTEGSDGTTVEIVHEVLITEWPTLARWLEEGQALRGFMHELRTATKQWVARNKPADLVWRGATAEEALATAKRHVLELSQNEQEFLDQVRIGMARGRRRRAAVMTAIIAVVGLFIAGGTFFTIRLSQANAAAQEKADEAIKAQKLVQKQLDEVKAAQAAQEKAQKEAAEKAAEALKANAVASQSKEDLAKANIELQQKVEEAEKANAVAQELARVAQENAKKFAAAKDAAEKATQEAKAAKARTETLLAAEKERVKKLEAEKAKISTGGLK